MGESIITKIGLDDSRFHAGLNRAQRGVIQLNKALGLVGAGLSVSALVGVSKSVLDLADNISTAAGTIGVNTDFLQEFQYAAEQMGIGTDKATMGLQRFARRLAQAQQGTGELLPTLQQLGIAMFDQEGMARGTEAVLNDFADALKGIQDPQAQLLAGFKAFDSEGAALINVLKNGSDGLGDLREQAHSAGAVLQSDLIKELDSADKSLKRLLQQAKITFARFAASAVRAFKVGQKFAENFFDQFFRRLPILKSALQRLLHLDFGGVGDELGKLKGVSQDLSQLYAEAVAEVDKQITKEKELLDIEGRRLTAIDAQTKALAKQSETQQKIRENAAKLAEAKRDRSLLTKEQLGGLPSAAAASDPIIAAINARIANLNAGLTPQGDRRLKVAGFENAKLAERQAQAFEALAKSLSERGLIGQSQVAQNRADFLRRANPFLQSGERDPFRVQVDQLKTMQDQLEQQKALTTAAGPQGKGLKVVPVMPS